MEDKIFELMAQAEDLQKHAVKLQNEAKEVLSTLPLAVKEAGQEIRSTGLQMALMALSIGVIVCIGAVATLLWSTDRLREERDSLKAAIQTEEINLANLQSKTWNIELMEWDNGERGIILPKGVNFVRPVKVKDGRNAIVISR